MMIAARLGRLFSPRGRLTRAPFWIATVAQSAAVMALVAADLLVFGDDPGAMGVGGWAVAVGLGLATLVLAALGFVLAIRRLHDGGLSGWWSLLGTIPVIGGPLLLAWIGLRRGTPGSNVYGPNPRGDIKAPPPPSPPKDQRRNGRIPPSWLPRRAGAAGRRDAR